MICCHTAMRRQTCNVHRLFLLLLFSVVNASDNFRSFSCYVIVARCCCWCCCCRYCWFLVMQIHFSCARCLRFRFISIVYCLIFEIEWAVSALFRFPFKCIQLIPSRLTSIDKAHSFDHFFLLYHLLFIHRNLVNNFCFIFSLFVCCCLLLRRHTEIYTCALSICFVECQVIWYGVGRVLIESQHKPMCSANGISVCIAVISIAVAVCCICCFFLLFSLFYFAFQFERYVFLLVVVFLFRYMLFFFPSCIILLYFAFNAGIFLWFVRPWPNWIKSTK